jgi:hypothetical protein
METAMDAAAPPRVKAIGLGLPLIGLLLLAAHFLRAGDPGLCLFLVGLAAAGFSRSAWLRPVLIATLLAAIGVWAFAWADFLRLRLGSGLPWLRLSLIMAGILLVSAGGIAWLSSAGSRAFFSRGAENALAAGLIFILTAVLLGVVREKVRFPILLLDRFLPGWGWFEILAIAGYAVWVGRRMLDPKKAPAVRSRIWGFFSLVFFLQLALGLAGVDKMLMTGALHLPVPAVIIGGPLYRGEGLFMPILYGATLLLVGPAWCSYLCYIGAWDDALSRRPRGRFRPLPAWAAHGRTAALALTVASGLGLRWAGAPVARAAVLALAFGLAGVGVMAVFSRRRGVMVHCTAYCPLGLLSNLLGRLSPWRMRIGSSCNRCGACARICRYGALSEADWLRGRPGASCSLCGDCLKACRGASIAYRFPGLSAETSRSAFLVLVVSLHAVFLGVARM